MKSMLQASTQDYRLGGAALQTLIVCDKIVKIVLIKYYFGGTAPTPKIPLRTCLVCSLPSYPKKEYTYPKSNLNIFFNNIVRSANFVDR